MKAIVMTAQDAREFEKLGGLTITKPIKPAPAAYVEGAQMLESTEAPGRWYVADTDGEPLLDSGNVFDPPVQPGDIVFLREPWARLKNPATGEPSDRVILAADSTVSEGQTSYKWASPVSMPEDAARRFAVVSKVEPIGVAFAVTTGECRYCHQLQEVGPHPTQAAADETATEVCSCPSARTARRIAEQIEDAQSRVDRLFGEGAEDLGFKPIAGDGAIDLLEKVVELIARGPISSASLNIRGQCKAKFSITSKGKIKVSRSETRSCDLEAGE